MILEFVIVLEVRVEVWHREIPVWRNADPCLIRAVRKNMVILIDSDLVFGSNILSIGE